MRAFAILAVLGLAACGGQGGVWANVPADDSPDGRACRAEARDNPEARRLAESVSSWNQAQDQVVRQQLLELLPRLWTDCMQRRGAIRGGVEPVRRATF